MKNLKIWVIVILVVITISCSENKNVANSNDNSVAYRSDIDIITMATPKGGKLKPAENGPIRSALGEPKIDLSTFTLEVTGLVDSSFSLSWDQIKNWRSVYSDTIIMYCIEGWEVWGNWKGILVSDLLDAAHLKADGTHVLFHCAENYSTALPISYLRLYKAILAYQVNDSRLQEHDGFPLRLIAFGKLGYKWAKWVNKLEVIDRSRIGYWEGYGYSDRADVSLERRKYYEGSLTEPLKY